MLHVAGKRANMVRDHNEQMSVAWHIGAFIRIKDMPRLASLMHSDKPRERQHQTPEEQIAVFKGILAGRRKGAT